MKWRRVTHESSGISCEVGRLTWRQKPLLATMIGEAFSPMIEAQAENAGQDAQIAAVRKALVALDDEILRPIFQAKVRDVQGLEGVTTGEELLEGAPDMHFILWLLNELVTDATVSGEEGKASGSPSTSSSAPTGDSASPAPSTELEAGPMHSTAPEMKADVPSSSRVA